MKYLILIGLLLVGCETLTEEQCKDIALKEAKEWQDLGYSQGVSRGVEICEENYKPMLEVYEYPENCMLLLKEQHLMQYICEGDEYYKELK